MVLRRVMTGVVAVVVAGFSVSMFGVLWHLNRYRPNAVDLVCAEDMIRWESGRYVAEIRASEGVFEQLTLYRKDSADKAT